MDQTPSAQTSAPPPPSSTPQPTEQPPSQLQAQQAQTQAPSPSPSPNPPPPTTTAAAAAATPPPSLPPPTTSTPPPLTTSSSPSILPSTNPTPKPPTTQPLQPRPLTTTSFNRPWQQPSPYTHFSLPPSPTPPLPSSTSPSSPAVSSAPRGGMAIGVPAHHPSPPSPSPTAFSSINPPPFGQKFGGLGRSVPDSMPSPSTSQVRQPIQGMQGMGMMGSLGSSSAMRPAGVPGHQFRPVQSSVRPPNSPTTQSPTTQNFQGHGMLRVQSVGSSGSSSSNTAQSLQPQNQPWLSSGTQGKPPLPPPSLRPPMSPQSLQQRSHIPQQQQQQQQQHQQQHQTMPTTPQQPQMSSSQQAQQPSTSSQPQEQFGQHYAPPRVQSSVPHQQQLARGQGLGIQRPSSHGIMQSGVSQPGAPSRTSGEENGESCNRIMSKRTIQEILTQIDPSEKLDPEVEDVLVDIAEEFVDSITTFGCSLAKHRKSTVLESKDILLHLERNWNITLPGFSGDEIKTYRKPATNDIHRERLAVIKKSIVAGEATNPKSSAGQASGNTKSHLAKGPANILGSPNPKIREAA